MSAIDTEEHGRVFEHLVGDMPVFGGAALAMDAFEGPTPKTAEQRSELQIHAGMMAGRVVALATLES